MVGRWWETIVGVASILPAGILSQYCSQFESSAESVSYPSCRAASSFVLAVWFQLLPFCVLFSEIDVTECGGTSTGRSLTSNNRLQCSVLVFCLSPDSGYTTCTQFSINCSFTMYMAFSQYDHSFPGPPHSLRFLTKTLSPGYNTTPLAFLS